MDVPVPDHSDSRICFACSSLSSTRDAFGVTASEGFESLTNR